jgi:hypothetical protein
MRLYSISALFSVPEVGVTYSTSRNYVVVRMRERRAGRGREGGRRSVIRADTYWILSYCRIVADVRTGISSPPRRTRAARVSHQHEVITSC